MLHSIHSRLALAVATAAFAVSAARAANPVTIQDSAGNKVGVTSNRLQTQDTNSAAQLAATQGPIPVCAAAPCAVGSFPTSSSVAVSVSTGTTTQIVALASSKVIYVTAWNLFAGGTGNATWEYGTGANCGTGTTALTGIYNLTAQTHTGAGEGTAPVLVVPASNALCLLTSAPVQISGSVSYTQF